jgi:hypothetical protein
MRINTVVIIFISGLLMRVGSARPVMVAVELNQQQIRQWRSFNYPTYDFINETAIAEVDEIDIPTLDEYGFEYELIDPLPWTEVYVILLLPEEVETALPGEVLLRKSGFILLKTPENRLIELTHMKNGEFRLLERRVLTERFWEHLLSKTVLNRNMEWDPFIQSIVDQVDTDSLTSYILQLQDFKTRLALTDSSYAASDWLRQKFNSWGYSAEFDSFYLDLSWPGEGYERNVIATIDGLVNPDRIFIICGHFDAIVLDLTIAPFNAPGADDNGSGTAATLEAARIFSNYPWKSTIKFINWAAEEPGNICNGSDHYAHIAESLGLDIGGVVNLDMIGYMDDPTLDCNVNQGGAFSRWLSDLFYLAGQMYAPALIIHQEMGPGGSDDYSFYIRGYSTVEGIERWFYFNPYYHDTTDQLNTLSSALYTSITKTAVATMAILGLYPCVVRDVAVFDIGDGNNLEIRWTANAESDVIGYNIYWGLESEIYTDTHFVNGAGSTADTLSDLMTDSTYYVVVRALDVDDRESPIAIEVTGVPRMVPLEPSGVVATPIDCGIRVDWYPNVELDLAGYRVYRRINDDTSYDSLNVVLLLDTIYVDTPLSGANKYYYALRTFDMDGNASGLSDEAYGRPITLDQGILIVDETRNSNFPPNPPPPDSLQDTFYCYILNGYAYTDFEFDSLIHRPIYADIVPYSTVLWHADDYSEPMASASVDDLRNYLDIGGRLWLVGWKLTANLCGSSGYPFDFGSGDFAHDYLKILHVGLSTPVDSFQGAWGLLEYPYVAVDSAKVPLSSWAGTLRYIEGLTSYIPGEDIYTIDMRNDSSAFEGLACGVRYLGSDYKTVFLGFPFYFMDQDEARAVTQQVMDDFGEMYIAEGPRVGIPISAVHLAQNSPNPFIAKTVIDYHVPCEGVVVLKVYNIVGQLVVTLVDGQQEPGSYGIVWDGKDTIGRKVGSGVYFYCLQMGESNIVKKMIVLR